MRLNVKLNLFKLKYIVFLNNIIKNKYICYVLYECKQLLKNNCLVFDRICLEFF